MNRGFATTVVALILVLLVAGCGGQSSGNQGSSAAPTSPPLTAGTHTSAQFQPTVSYTVPDGWTNPQDTPAYLELFPVQNDSNGIHIFHNPQALSQASDCPTSAQPGVGTSSVELVAWIRSIKGFAVSPPALATIGGLPATSIDVAIAQGWTQSCSFAGGLPTVPLFFGRETSLRWVVADKERLRLYLVDVPGNGTVVVDVDSFDGAGFTGLLAAAAPIVKSITFAAP